MKKIFARVFIGLTIIVSIASCEDELEERYTNPDQTSDASIGKFFTKMLNNDRIRPSYWNVRTFLVMHPARYTNIVSYTNSNQRYQQQLSYIDDYWRDYFTPTGSGIVAHLREMEKTYASLSEDEKPKFEVFMRAAYVIYAEQTSKMVDLWGDIPFSEAGQLNLNGNSTPPKFDDAEEIYEALIALLEESADYFSSVNLESTISASFSKQDILLHGSLGNWERFANSLKLRLLMRISFVDESTAEAGVMEMLNNPDDYPLVDNASHNVLLDALLDYNDNMRSALTELTSHIAPEFLLEDVLKPANDPRIRMMFDKNTRIEGNGDLVWNEDYFSMPVDISSTDQDNGVAKRFYAVLDSVTFLENSELPGIVMTASEVNFLKAEAYERWGNSADARTAYEQGVTDAVEFMYFLNNINGRVAEERKETLEDGEIEDLLANPNVEYVGTTDELLEKIWTQKWLSLGFMQSIESWAEVRRTKTPSLTFVPDNSTPSFSLPSSRLLYPDSEKTYNPTNYSRVASSDLSTGKIFWDVK